MNPVEYALMFIGRPYIWGGDGSGSTFGGFDCSGLVVECLQAVGVLKNGSDFTAKGLYKHLLGLGWARVAPGSETPGDVCFWGKSEASISHISLALGDGQHVEAGGGGSKCRTLKSSTGMVRIRPMSARSDLLCILRRV